MTIWFSADPHYGHKSIIEFCDRPFKDVEEMNKRLIENWNLVVQPNDDVYMLGDVSFMKASETVNVLNALKGKIYLIKGNHDKNNLLNSAAAKQRFEWIKDMYELKVHDLEASREKQIIVMCHYPMLTWNKSHHGSWMLHGHCHGNLPVDPHAKRHDVGVDSNAYAPVSYEMIKEIMSTKQFKPIDHHTERSM